MKSLPPENFQYYAETLMFSLDHHNMPDGNQYRCLKVVHPTLYEKLSNGKFTVQKTNRKFSKIALDQNHKQLNTVVGGAIALNENDAALQR